MFSMTRNQLLAVRSMAPDLDPHEDYSWLLHQSCPDAYVSRVATLTIACADIRMQVDRALTGGQRNPDSIRTVLGLLRKAQAISKKLSALDQPQNAVWRVKKKVFDPDDSDCASTISSSSDSGGSDAGGEWSSGDAYSFHNLYVCMIYNIIWTSHLFLTTCIFRCMAWLMAPDGWRSGEEYELAVAATKRRIGDIVASMAYACSWNGYQQGYADFPCGTPELNSPSKGVAGMFVFRPAFTAMMSDFATPQQKRYLHGRLRFLADTVGIKQVNVLLKVCRFLDPCLGGARSDLASSCSINRHIRRKISREIWLVEPTDQLDDEYSLRIPFVV